MRARKGAADAVAYDQHQGGVDDDGARRIVGRSANETAEWRIRGGVQKVDQFARDPPGREVARQASPDLGKEFVDQARGKGARLVNQDELLAVHRDVLGDEGDDRHGEARVLGVRKRD